VRDSAVMQSAASRSVVRDRPGQADALRIARTMRASE
jgi:hypothetical protein